VTCVGIVANPSSGKDIRRLVAHGSVFPDWEKANIVRRVLLGLDALGIASVVTMPDFYGICLQARNNLTLSTTVEELEIPVTRSRVDTVRAAGRMRELKVACVVILGGDGTNRVVAKMVGDTPILPVSTGTNNVFPYMIEGTLAGLAAGLVAGGLVPAADVVVRRPRLDVEVNDEVVDIALVDAVVCDREGFAAGAVNDFTKTRLVVVAQCSAAHIGFMGLAGHLPRDGDHDGSGMVLETDPDAPAVLAPIAPGLVLPVGVRRHAPLRPGEEIELPRGTYGMALDGELERTILPADRVVIRLNPEGPRVIDPYAALSLAAERGVFLLDGCGS